MTKGQEWGLDDGCDDCCDDRVLGMRQQSQSRVKLKQSTNMSVKSAEEDMNNSTEEVLHTLMENQQMTYKLTEGMWLLMRLFSPCAHKDPPAPLRL